MPTTDPIHGASPDDDPIQVVDPGFLAPDEAAWLGSRVRELHAHAAPGIRRLTVRLVDDASMCAMHARHMDDPSTTDVLSFVEGDQVDVAVCVDEARRRAADLGHEFRRELLLYSLHGMLHAAGFDDRTPEDHARMHAEEDRLLGLIGIAATFAPGGGPA